VYLTTAYKHHDSLCASNSGAGTSYKQPREPAELVSPFPACLVKGSCSVQQQFDHGSHMLLTNSFSSLIITKLLGEPYQTNKLRFEVFASGLILC
jgi:hypothetical protein